MSLSIDRIVGINISSSPLALQSAGFGIMNIIGITDVISTEERLREYGSITEVAEDFDSSDEEYKAASIYFSQSPRPSTLYISRRLTSESISDALDAIEAVNSKWYGFSFTKEVRDDSQTAGGSILDCLDAAAWAEARTKTFWNNTSDVNTLSATDTTSISYALSAAEYSRTITTYSADDYPSISLMARGATVDFNGTDTTITYMFKQLPGITTTNLSSTQASALTAVNCNYYTQYGTQLSGDAVSIVANGVAANGVFIDEVVGVDWLGNAIQTDVFNYLFQSTTKIPQTDEGVAGIEQVLDGVLAKAVNNGLAAPGYVTINNEAVFLPKGYEIITGLVENQSQADREARKAPPIQFFIKGAGAIHGVTIAGTFVR